MIGLSWCNTMLNGLFVATSSVVFLCRSCCHPLPSIASMKLLVDDKMGDIERSKLLTFTVSSLGIIAFFALDTAVQKGLKLHVSDERKQWRLYLLFVLTLFVVFVIMGKQVYRKYPTA